MTQSRRPRRRSPRAPPPPPPPPPPTRAPDRVLRRSRAKPAQSGLGSLPAPPHPPGPPPPSRKRPPRRWQLSRQPRLDLASAPRQLGSPFGAACRPALPHPQPELALDWPLRTLPQAASPDSQSPWNRCQTHTRLTVSPSWRDKIQTTMWVSSHSRGRP
ncbi:hypothetical protein AB1E18_010753 [Capra hircus]